jgi:hypothetical protein
MSVRNRRSGMARRRAASILEVPFTMPTRAAMAASAKRVIVYYHTIPLYTRNAFGYPGNISPSGAGGAYSDIGGRWRAIPLIGANLPTTPTAALRQQMMLLDVTNAANLGADAFWANIVPPSLPGGTETWRWTEQVLPLYAAADQFSSENAVGFKVAPSPTMLGIQAWSGAQLGDPVFWADQLAPLLQHPAAHMIDGKPAINFYNVSSVPPQWYIDFLARLSGTYGITAIYGVPSYQGNNVSVDMAPYLPLFQSGLFRAYHSWTFQSYTITPANYMANFRAWASSNGIPYCGLGPAWLNDRPDLLKEVEGRGLTILQTSWDSVMLANDPMVQLVSWNDTDEQHGIRPTTGYQWVPYDVSAYNVARFKMGTAPTVTRDTLYYQHRMHAGGATFDTTKQTAGPYNVTFAPILDKVFVTAFLTAPADVTITTGGVPTTVTAPAGVSTIEAPFVADDVPKFKAVRGGVTVVPEFSSAFPTRSDVAFQDLLVRMGSSTRPPVAGVQSDMPGDRT